MDTGIGLLLLAAVCVTIGYISAVLVSNLRQADDQDDRASEDLKVDPEGMEEAFRVLRSADGKFVQPEIDGRRPATAAKMTAEQHAAISLALVDLYSWMEGGAEGSKVEEAREGQAAVDEMAQAPGQDGELEPEPSASGESEKVEPPVEGDSENLEDVKEAEDETSVAASESNGSQEKAQVSAGLPSINIIKSLVHTARSEIKDKVEPDAQSIAFQVDEILQAKLEGSSLEDQAIRLLDLPGQGMVILIGLDKFDGIEAVPDEEIKKLLRESVAEWETKMLGKRK